MMPADLSQAEKQKRSLEKEQDFLEYGQRTMELADEYCLVGNLIWQRGELFRKASFAMLVNAAFACELYMKSIIACTLKKKESGHNLNYLFYSLKDDIKEQIQKSLPYKTYELKMLLHNIGKVFSVVRYASEVKGMTIDAEFLILFMNILKKVCKKSMSHY